MKEYNNPKEVWVRISPLFVVHYVLTNTFLFGKVTYNINIPSAERTLLLKNIYINIPDYKKKPIYYTDPQSRIQDRFPLKSIAKYMHACMIFLAYIRTRIQIR
jgi:hypothetical protein